MLNIEMKSILAQIEAFESSGRRRIESKYQSEKDLAFTTYDNIIDRNTYKTVF